MKESKKATKEAEDNLYLSNMKKVMGDDDISENTKKVKGKIAISQDEENQSRLFPAALYCPITKELFERPVVVHNGDSFELSVVEEDYEPARLYENRALQEIIKEAKTKTNTGDTNDFVKSLQNIQNNMKTNLSHLVNRSLLTSNLRGPLPNAYYCPITLDLMYDPVIDTDGTTYDRRAIINWIRANGKSPFTRKELKVESLYPNNAIKDLIHSELDKPDESMHPSILKWKIQLQKQQDEDQQEPQEDNTSADGFLPVTEEQTEERRGRRRKKLRSKVQFCLVSLVLFCVIHYLLPYYLFIFVFLLSLVSITYIRVGVLEDR